jgi:hypothetical protein
MPIRIAPLTNKIRDNACAALAMRRIESQGVD